MRPRLRVRTQTKGNLSPCAVIGFGGAEGGAQMNWDQIKGNWNQFKGRVKQQWGDLTDDDLTRIEGRRDELIGRLQERYGYENEQAEEEVRNWERDLV
jgi:uncharacterized protein YjbJ (UPF0337 family)